MASKLIKGITIEIGGDTTKLGKAIKDVETKARGLQSELKGVNTLLKMDPKNVTLLAQKQDILTKSIASTGEKLKTLKDTQAQVQAQFEKGEITEEQYRDFQREIEATEIKLKSLTKELKEFGSVGAQQVAAVGEKMKEVGGKIEDTGKKLAPVSAAAAGALVGVSKAAIDFETAWTGVTKTVDGTDEQLGSIKQGLLDLSQQTSSSAVDIAAVAEAAGQLGIKTDDVLSFTETMVQLGDSTNLSAEEAASALAKFANITQMSADDYGKLGSVIVDLGNNFATTEADIVSMATRLASTGEFTGLSEAQIMALAAALSSAGIEAEAGGSAMAKLLKQTYNTVATYDSAKAAIDRTNMSLRDLQLMQSLDGKGFKELAGSLGMTTKELSAAVKGVDQMNKYASTAGVSVADFKKAYGEDAVGALSMFITGLNDTERNGKNAVEILNSMGLTEVRLSNAILSMASSGSLMTDAIKTANIAWGENTALTTEAEKRYATTAAKLTQLKNTITELAVKLGEILLPIIQNVTEKLKSIVDWLTNLSPATQKVILTVTALVAALAPTLIMVGKITSAMGSILTFAPKFVTFGSTITKVLGLIKTAFSGLFTFILANPIVAAIAAVVAAIVLLYTKCEWFRNGVHKIVEWIKNAVVKLGKGIADFFTKTIPDAFNKVVTWFKELPGKIGSALSNALTKVKTWGSDMVSKAKETGRNFIDSVVTFFKELPGKIGAKLSEAISKVRSWASDLIAKGKEAASGLASSVVNGLKSLPEKVKTVGTNIVQGLWNGIKNAKDWLVGKIKGFCSDSLGAIKKFFGINSPSKVMADEVGKWLPEGMAKGVTKNTKSAVKAMQSMAKTTVSAASDELAAQTAERNLQHRTTQAAAATTATSAGFGSKLDAILAAIEKGSTIMLDGNLLVGGTANRMDATLGQRRALVARGAL